MKRFNCTSCGDCCSGLMEIRLNLYDLYKMAKHLKLTNTKLLFTKGYLKLIKGQNNILIPQMIFKIKPYSFCPFLINDLDEEMELKGYCSLHPYIKPLVCILAPISKEYDIELNSNSYSFTKPTEHCPGTLEGDDLPVEDLLLPVKLEIDYENQFYNILNIILKDKIENYVDLLYYFDITDNFESTLLTISANITK